MAKFKEDNVRINGKAKGDNNDVIQKAVFWIKENFSTIILPLIAIILLAFGIYFYSITPSQAPPVQTSPKVTTETKKDSASEKPQDVAKQETVGTGGPEAEVFIEKYIEKAASGEGITHLARKALKRYLSSEGVSLSLTKEHKIYIEDYMKDMIGSFKLKVGQEISFSTSLIKDGIAKAQKLSVNSLNNLKKYSRLVPSL